MTEAIKPTTALERKMMRIETLQSARDLQRARKGDLEATIKRTKNEVEAIDQGRDDRPPPALPHIRRRLIREWVNAEEEHKMVCAAIDHLTGRLIDEGAEPESLAVWHGSSASR